MREREAIARKRRSHETIELAAARVIRREGTRGASVRRMMAEAGLTIGGFYSHFPSKQQLIRDAFSTALGEFRLRFLSGIEGRRGRSFVEGFLRSYLTPEHRDHPENGCPFAALASELPRQEEVVRSRVSEEFERIIASFASRLDGRPAARAREQAIAVTALAVGALALSRSLVGSAGSDEVLAAALSASPRLAGLTTPEDAS